ncbi:MAG: hypothetical protein FWG67_00550, partial [Defluviitaleaceae bacterium]|nr:hypothetical protein [Defluviitaleaceae bacterium]
MSINIQERIRRLREDSPLLGRNARHYIADVLEGLFKSQVAHYGTSSTEADVVEKHVLSPAPGFDVPGRSTKLAVHFTHGNTAINPTLRVGATQPAYPISKVSNWAAGTTVEFVFDGETWRMLGAKKATVTHPLMDMATGHVGTDNGEFANADHVHPVHIYHDTSHVVSGRFVLDRMPTSEVANRVLAVGTAETTPEFQQVNDQMIANNAVVTRTIMDQNVTEPKLADNAVITRTIMDQNVTTPKLADLAVTEAKLADNAVVTRTIMDQNVTESKLADDAVVTRTILDQNVTESKLADNAVVTRTIMDQNVT